MVRPAPLFALGLALVVMTGACDETLDAGTNRQHGLLPVDERNPLVLINDWAYDNWSGEYAVLLANTGGPPLAGIIVNTTSVWGDIQKNVSGWRDLVAAARESGLQNIPDPQTSVGAKLVMPASGNIDDTRPNRSEGALFIVNQSKTLSLPNRPMVVATGDGLTDVADAYLIDHSVTERVVVVASLGGTTASGGSMNAPNGDEDPWADTIVANRFRYIQVSAFYNQQGDVPTAKVAQLPATPFGAWMAAKQPNLWQWFPASDQVAVLAVGIPTFASSVARVAADPTLPAGSTVGPGLGMSPYGQGWLVNGCDGQAPAKRLWEMLGKVSTGP
ncbi:MAG TPA: hypothetical protein VHM31_14730 [Polyangia bacterium]|nr:hypothetical protein [Polyangia bacterium]